MTKKIIVSKEVVVSLNSWKKQIEKNNQYSSYLTVRDVNKIGRRHEVFCVRQKRLVHLLSDGEFRAYKILLWQPSTISVEEQFPLDIDETLNIAISNKIIHPRNWQTNLAHVMTTDFVVTSRVNGNEIKKTAYTFKYWDQIFENLPDGIIRKTHTRTWQKFAIEREYWRKRGVEYRVITELDTTKACAWNIEYFELAHDFETSFTELKEFGEAFIESWLSAPRDELQEHLSNVQLRLKTTFNRAKSLFQYSGLHQLLPIDTKKYIRLFRPIELIL